MGSRKDIIKRSLGITEYPWSSDDELEESTLAVEEPSLRRPPMEPRPSASDASGSSGLPPQQLSQLQQLHQLQQQHPQAHHHHHQQQQHVQQQQQNPQAHHHHQQNVEPQQQQHSTSRRNQARLDRDLFWSIINSPHRIPIHSPRSRSSDVPVSRVNHVPAAELRERGPERPAAADIQRILAFKRLTRNLSSLRHRGNMTGVIPITRVNPGVIVPSEANSSIRINRLPIRRFFRTGLSESLPPRNSPGQAAPPSDGSAGRVGGGGRHRSRPRDAPDGQDDSPRTAPPPLARISSVEVNNNPLPPTADPIILDEENVDQDMSLEGEHDVEAIANSGVNVTLEEDIVDLDHNDIQSQMAVDEDEVQEVHASTSAADDEPGPTAAGFPAEYRRPSSDPTMASTSGATSDADPQQSREEDVTRKRQDSDESLEPYTVKEFNQNLLRLLECPVCLEWMEPPMSQCRRGHLVCGRCRARLASCPVCRTTFSSVRNRAMEGVAEMLRYPCRHGCGREVRLRRRAPHEASCAARKYLCPTPACTDQQPLPRAQLAHHFQPVEHTAGGTLPPLQGGEEILLEPDYVPPPIESDGFFSSDEGRLPSEVIVLHSLDFAHQPNHIYINGSHPRWELQSFDNIPYLRDLRERAVALANESRHLSMLKIGRRHKFSLKVNSEQHDNWLILALEEYFHLRIDVDIRTWGVVVYVSYIGPKCDAKNYTYEVTIDGQHNQRKLVYARTTHSDLESSSLNVSRQDCFHLTLDQALNFIRFKNRHCDAEKFLDFNVEIGKVEQPATPREESDS